MDNENSLIVVADEMSQYINMAVDFVDDLMEDENFNIAVFNLTAEERKKLNNKSLYLDKKDNLTFEHIRKTCKRLKQKNNINTVIIDLEDKDINEDHIELSKKLKELAKELNLLIGIFINVKKVTNRNFIIIDNVEDKDILEYADMIIISKYDYKNKKMLYIAKSDNDKYPVGYIDLEKRSTEKWIKKN